MLSEIKSNPHTHTQRVDGKNTARELIERALSLGFESLGFTEHAEEAYCGLTKDGAEAYIAEINALKQEYAGRIKLWLGIERDRLSTDNRRERYDYILGANHYFTARDGRVFAVDNGEDELVSYVETCLAGSWEAAAKEYFEVYADYICELKPDIIAHFDLLCKYNHRHNWFDENSDAFIQPGKAALDRMINACNVLEVNTGAMARTGRPCPYPALPLLKHWRSLGGKVIISSDCHNAQLLDACFDNAVGYIKSAGFKTALKLGTGNILFEEYEL